MRLFSQSPAGPNHFNVDGRLIWFETPGGNEAKKLFHEKLTKAEAKIPTAFAPIFFQLVSPLKQSIKFFNDLFAPILIPFTLFNFG
jgi:hypothetical protein